jgi:hypothetical protein
MLYADIQNVYSYKTDQLPILTRETDINGFHFTNPTDPLKYSLKYIEGDSGTVPPTIEIIVEFKRLSLYIKLFSTINFNWN